MKSNSYTLWRKFILLASCMFLGIAVSVAQRTVTGTVTDQQTGETLIGANVLVKGTSSGTVTDLDGNYSIEVSEGDILIFSYTGYSAQEIAVAGQDRIDVIMSSGELLEEIVVIGYGTAKKKDLTGSVALINNDDFNKGVIVSADQLIQGKTAGVQVLNNSGQPGAATTVRIRGNTSIRLAAAPLYVLDGVPLSGRSARPTLEINDDFGGTADGNPLTWLNPNDIESMTILKDASATAIYGSRGANGVIEITTKKGQLGPPSVHFATSVGVSSILRKYDVLNGSEYRDALSQYPSLTTGDYGDDVDAFDEILRTGLVQNHSISIHGGNDRGRYRMSVGYFGQDGIVKKNDLRRISANIRGNFDLLNNDRVNMDFWLYTSNTNENSPPITTNSNFRGSLIGNALQWNPTHPLYEADGSPIIDPQFGDFMNPVALNEAWNDNASTFDVIGAISPSVKILDNLTYRFTYSLNHSTGERRASIKPWINMEGIEGQGGAYIFNKTLTSHILQHTLNWNIDFGSNTLGLLGGYEYQKLDEKSQSMSALGFTDADIDFTYAIQDATNPATIESQAPPISELQSYFARAQLNLLDDRFLVTATFRADGSSKFGENNKYGYFPSFAAAWNIHNESFASGGFFNNLKLRAGWGVTGNQDFDSGAALDRYALIGNGAAEQTNVGNPDLKWETTSTLNFGVDYAFLNYRLYGSIDYFNRQTTDLLFQLAPSQPAPSTLYWVNLDGEVVNQGWEFVVNALAVDQPNFQWDIGLNLTLLSNELRNYTGPNFTYGQLFGQGITGSRIHRLESNQPLNAMYLRDWQGLDSEGFDTFRDANGNIVGATQDAFYLGDPNPDVLLGLSTTFTFGAFSLGLNFNGAMGHQIYNNTRNTVTPIGNLGSRNIDSEIYGLGENLANSVKSSTRYMENGDYVKLANATFTYTIGDIGNVISDARIYVTGSNLFVLTGYTGFDPEVNTINDANGLPSAGIDYIPYPSARTFIIGLNFRL